jgi:hypothetical protein
MTKSRPGRLAALALTTLLLGLFWDSIWLWPLKILVVMFHELSHALAALLTGGQVLGIELSPNQGGVTHTRGGWRFLVLNAGYLGSLGFGLALLIGGRHARRARVGVGALALLLLGATLWWVQPIVSFGFAFSGLFTLAMLLLARKGSDVLVMNVLQGLGLFSVMYALWDIRSDVFSTHDGPSDASMLAELTWIPAPLWGLAWLALGALSLYATRTHWAR